MNVQEISQNYECDLYPKRDLCLVRGEGTHVWDYKGNSYLDCVVGHGTANLGHNHVAITQAIHNQVDVFVTCSNVFYNDRRSEYLEKLIQMAPEGLNRAYLCSSGTESVEAAMKFARLTTGRTGFISAMRGFHGRTFGSLSLTFNPKYRKPFQPHLPDCSYVAFNKIEALEKEINENTAAVILEVVQGEGGVNVGDRTYFKAVRELCDKKGTLLVIDEVQTGFGRSGHLFATQGLDLVPDMITIAKAMGGGIPMGGVLCSDRIEVTRGIHGTTFGGNPLSCAAGLAVLELLENPKFLSEVRRKGELFQNQLRTIENEKIKEVRGLGLMIGVELNTRVQPYLLELMEQGVLALPAGPKVLRFLPPLTISDREINQVVAATRDVLEKDL